MELQADDVQALHLIEELTISCVVPFAFKAMVKMGVPDIQAAAGHDAMLTAQQIVDKVPHKSTADAARKLGRILRLLALKGVFTESTTDSLLVTEARYGLTKASRLLVTGTEYDLKPFLELVLQPGYEETEPLKHLREVVEEDANAYRLAFGWDNPFSHRSTHPEQLEVFNTSMRSWSKLYNSNFAHHYPGFKDVKCLVDVGGGVGGALAVFVSVNPHINGVNFDRPHVIATTLDIPGVKHVGGSFFESVPSGDTILLQHVLHNWGDEDCIKILKNCHETLLHSGKLLILENVIDPARTSVEKTGATLSSDILMMALFNGGGGERTSGEYKRLLLASGFSKITILNVQGLNLIECVKT